MARKCSQVICMCVALITSNDCSYAGVIEFWNDSAGWLSAVQNSKFIDFTEFSHGTIISDQIPGLTFTTFVFIHNAQGYTDGFGLLGGNGIKLTFDTPHHAVGIDHLGDVTFALYLEGTLVNIAPTYCNVNCPFPGVFAYPGSGVAFSGIVSDTPFDEVYFFVSVPPYSNNVISIDNLYWGLPIPAPGALPLLSLAMLVPRRRRSP